MNKQEQTYPYTIRGSYVITDKLDTPFGEAFIILRSPQSVGLQWTRGFRDDKQNLYATVNRVEYTAYAEFQPSADDPQVFILEQDEKGNDYGSVRGTRRNWVGTNYNQSQLSAAARAKLREDLPAIVSEYVSRNYGLLLDAGKDQTKAKVKSLEEKIARMEKEIRIEKRSLAILTGAHKPTSLAGRRFQAASGVVWTVLFLDPDNPKQVICKKTRHDGTHYTYDVAIVKNNLLDS